MNLTTQSEGSSPTAVRLAPPSITRIAMPWRIFGFGRKNIVEFLPYAFLDTALALEHPQSHPRTHIWTHNSNSECIITMITAAADQGRGRTDHGRVSFTPGTKRAQRL